jgi:hypothetical protein
MENNKSSPKLINEYSVEELLKLMDSSKEDVTQKSEEEYVNNESIRFLAYYDIKPGNHRISTKLLFKLFKSWTKDRSYKYENFVRDLFSQLEIKNTTFRREKYQYFKINKNILNITRYLEESKPKKIIFRKTMFYKKFMEEFLEQHNIKAGPIFVEADILYYLFDYYNQKKTRRMVSYERFVSLCHLYFESKQLGFGSTWFGVNESIKSLITEEWVKTWRQGRVKYGYIIKEKDKELKSKLYLQKNLKEETQLQKILYSETLPKEESKK